MCRHREIRESLPSQSSRWVRDSKHGNSNNTVSKKTQIGKEAQRSTKREPERKAQRETRGAETEKGRGGDTQKCLERDRESQRAASTDVHACTHTPTPLLCGAQKKTPSQDPCQKTPSFLL